MTTWAPLATVGIAVVVVAVARYVSRRTARRMVYARLGDPGPMGIVPGAEPIVLHGTGPVSVLVLHGFGDTPQSVAYLAHALHARGWTVHAPLLPGHGRTIDAFADSSGAQWLDHARRELDAMRGRGGRIAIVGQSMGGALSVLLASASTDIDACVLISPLLSLTSTMRRGAYGWRLVGIIWPVVDSSDERSIHDPDERSRSRGYGLLPMRLLPELVAIVQRARTALAQLSAPTLIVQSTDDNRVTVDGTDGAFRLINAADKRLVWRSGAGHVLSVDTGRDDVIVLAGEWIASHTVAGAVPRV